MYKAQINTLSAMLTDADEEAIDRCEAMYVAKFRSSGFVLFGTLEEEEQQYIISAAKEVASAKMGITKPVYNGDNESEMEAWENSVQVEIFGDTKVVYLCNYKGEGEGFALWEDAKHLPVFKSKNDSRNLFGA